jgi:hypothetical protein
MPVWHYHTFDLSEITHHAKESLAYIFLLLVNMSNLKVDVFLCQWRWWNRNDVPEALYRSQYPRVNQVAARKLPRDFAGTFVVACKLCRGENKFHLPFQNLAASSSPEKRPPRRVQEIHIYHRVFLFRTTAWAPANLLAFVQ